MKKIGFIMIFILALALAMSTIETMATVAYANNNKELTEALEGLRNEEGGIIDNDAKDKARGISKDIMDIVMIVITAIVVISGLITGAKFSSAGDNPQLKASLKSKLIWHILGLVFLANYFGLFEFLLRNVQIF